ncbi:MAG: cardiolipin synthase [Rikenellaceae bacterium]|nr:cardiolipin synthase [Rikenellaceae bacterium]
MSVIPLVAFSDIKLVAMICYVLVIVATICIIIHEKRDPVKALAWITVIALVPVGGLVLYIMFGRNHRKQKIFDLKELEDLEEFNRLSRKQLEAIQKPDLMVRSSIADNRDVITLLLNTNKSLLTMRNRVRVLNNGKETFSELLTALRSAKSSIHIEYYIFENDRIGKKISKILMDKAREGVEVRFIYDDVGSWGLGRKFIRNLKNAGVQVGCFMPVVFPWLTSRVNYRNHRKIVVVDGMVGFTGGINIAERYLRRGRRGIWRDTHLKLEGESVAMLQAIFATDWYFVSGKKRIGISEKYFPKTRVTEETPVQIATSGPDSDWASIMQAFFAAITRAQKHIYISSPYFLPNQAILTALKIAALSGIDVRIMIPSRSDTKIVYWATRSYISELMEAGIKVYLYCKGFNHSKVIMIDSLFSSVGTANMDIRSFEDNFEVTAIMYDRRIAKELEESFMQDIGHCIEVTPEMWEQRSNLHSVYESLARLLSPLL